MLLVIVAEFPWSHLSRTGNSVRIQQDGAKSHIEEDDKEWPQAVEEMNVKLCTQTAQSPDLNINDLAFFTSLTSLKKEEGTKEQP